MSCSALEHEIAGIIESIESDASDVLSVENLFTSNVVHSVNMLTLILELEKKYEISIDGDDMTIDNFKNVASMAALVQRFQSRS